MSPLHQREKKIKQIERQNYKQIENAVFKTNMKNNENEF